MSSESRNWSRHAGHTDATVATAGRGRWRSGPSQPASSRASSARARRSYAVEAPAVGRLRTSCSRFSQTKLSRSDPMGWCERGAADYDRRQRDGGGAMEHREDAPEGGDFAKGEETLPHDEHVGSFAEGEETLERDEHAGSFAEGEETLPEDERKGSFADTDEDSG